MDFLITAAIAGTVTAVLILLVKYIFKDKLHPKLQKLRWSLAAAVVIIAIAAASLTNGREQLAVYDIWDHSLKVPAAWTEMTAEETAGGSGLMFALNGVRIAGVDRLDADPSRPLPAPNHSQEKYREEIGGLVTDAVLINYEISEPAASGDSAAVNENHLYLLFKDDGIAYDIYADSAYVSRKELLDIGRNFYKAEWEGSFKPSVSPKSGSGETAVSDVEKLLSLYFDNYVELDLPMARDISGYKLGSVEIAAEAGSYPLYPQAFLCRADYQLEPTDSEKFGMAGGGFFMNEEGWIQYDETYAIIRIAEDRKLQLLGFLHPSSIGEYGLDGAVRDYLGRVLYSDGLATAFTFKTSYIGDASKTRGIISNLGLAQYFDSMALQTKTEPYGLTVTYDVSGIADALTADIESGAEPSDPGLEAMLAKNSIALFALIGNLDEVTFVLDGTGTATGQMVFTYERRSWEDRLGTDIRSYSTDAAALAENIAAAIPGF